MSTATVHAIAADIDFSTDESDEQFFSRGRFSVTKMLRTVALLNSQATRAEFVAACALRGIHPNTAAKQFGLSRKLALEQLDDVELAADGSLVDRVPPTTNSGHTDAWQFA